MIDRIKYLLVLFSAKKCFNCCTTYINVDTFMSGINMMNSAYLAKIKNKKYFEIKTDFFIPYKIIYEELDDDFNVIN